jgi:hypothetical protein
MSMLVGMLPSKEIEVFSESVQALTAPIHRTYFHLLEVHLKFKYNLISINLQINTVTTLSSLYRTRREQILSFIEVQDKLVNQIKQYHQSHLSIEHNTEHSNYNEWTKKKCYTSIYRGANETDTLD